MRPYKIVQESDSFITYEYRTAYTWALYGVLLVFFVGMTTANDALLLPASFAIAIYFVAKLALGNSALSRIKKSMRAGGVQLSGHKSSFKTPLRIRVAK